MIRFLPTKDPGVCGLAFLFHLFIYFIRLSSFSFLLFHSGTRRLRMRVHCGTEIKLAPSAIIDESPQQFNRETVIFPLAPGVVFLHPFFSIRVKARESIRFDVIRDDVFPM